MQPKHPRDSETVMAELMLPQHANIMGNVFGGVILSLVDRVAAVCAIRHAGKQCVTVSVDKVDFKEPIHVGELITAFARVNFAGRRKRTGRRVRRGSGFGDRGSGTTPARPSRGQWP